MSFTGSEPETVEKTGFDLRYLVYEEIRPSKGPEPLRRNDARHSRPKRRWDRLLKETRIFWPLLITVFLADCTTKRAAVESLSPGNPQEVVGETVRFSLTFNDSAAMGLPAGEHGKEILGVLSIVVAGFLGLWYRRSSSRDALLSGALALVIAGALGNAWERLLSPRGVVDFIDIGVGALRFWTFNIADVAITIGACLLAISLWREERRGRRHPAIPRV